MKPISTVYILGMGAMGMLYGAQIQDAYGKDSFAFIMDEARYDKHKDEVHNVNGVPYTFPVVRCDDAPAADLIIVAVKGPVLKESLKTVAGVTGPDTIFVSIMNGISTEDVIRERFPEAHVVDAVNGGMDAVCLDKDLTFTHVGWLRLGSKDGSENEAAACAYEYLKELRAKVTNLEQDITRAIWFKYILNVGFNQTCMVYDCGYGKVLEEGSLENAIMVAAMREVVMIAEAEGIDLTEADLRKTIDICKTFDPDGMPSMAQDRIKKRPSEVELFSGAIMELGAKHDILVPANAFLNRRVHEIEAEYL